MKIKKLVTTVAEENIEIELPVFLKENTSILPNFVMIAEDFAIRTNGKNMIWIDNFLHAEREVSKYISEFQIAISDDEFFESYNKALSNIQSRIPENISK